MKTRIRMSRFLLPLLSLAGTLAAASPARADTTFFVEAEGPVLSVLDYTITSPLRIIDDSTASMGRYLAVETGFDSKTAPPTEEGIARNHIFVPEDGVYKIWGRVQAPTDGDDSFWIRIDGGSAIKWNPIEPGSAWHWDLVKHDGSSTPSTFTLSAGDHLLEISYREDGAKLDVLAFTSDSAFNPDSPPTTAPSSSTPGIASPLTSSIGSKTAIKVMWSSVPGAVSYNVRRDTGSGFSSFQTGLTNLKLGDTGVPSGFDFNCYDVQAVFPDNTTGPVSSSTCSQGLVRYDFIDVTEMSLTSPLVFDLDNIEINTAPGTTESLNTVPAHGRARVDFMTGGSAQLRLWFNVSGPNVDADSFWVRMDDGAWSKWNNFTVGCMPVGDFTNTPVTFNVGAGTHRFEISYREIGAKLDSVFFITDNLQATSSLCDD